MVGALSYASLVYWLSTETTILVMLIVPVFQAIAFWLILVHPKDTIPALTKRQETGSREQIVDVPKKTLREKAAMVPGLFRFMIPIGLVYLFEYFINQGLVRELCDLFN